MSRVSKIIVRTRIPDSEIKKFKGIQPRESHFDISLVGDVNLYSPKGELIFAVRKGAVPEDIYDECYESFHWLRNTKTNNRGSYTGTERYKRIKPDGTVTKNSWAKNVSSATIGFYDRYPRIPYCRQTAFMQHKPELWEKTVPFFQYVSSLLKEVNPSGWQRQKDAVMNTHSDWIIPGTVFTTSVVNNCTLASYHQDGGDLKSGFGCMAVFRKGDFTGGDLVLPQYRVAVDLGHRDIIFFNPCIWHGNLPYRETVGERIKDWERISIVCFFREKMQQCLCKEEELKRAKALGKL